MYICPRVINIITNRRQIILSGMKFNNMSMCQYANWRRCLSEWQLTHWHTGTLNNYLLWQVF